MGNEVSPSEVSEFYDIDVKVGYTGDMVDGKRHGKGTEVFPDGDRYVGDYKNDTMEGLGTYNFRNGQGVARYTGEFKDGLRNGEGTEYSHSGNKVYEGGFKDGERNGEGILYDSKDGSRKEGNFKNGRFDGEIIGYSKDGDMILTYNYENGVMHGKQAIYSHGICVGATEYVRGSETGIRRIYDDKNGKLVEEIDRVNGVNHGFNRFFSYQDGERKLFRIIQYKNGKLNEKRGLYYMKDGSFFEGEVNDQGYPSGGMGIIHYPDGSKLYASQVVIWGLPQGVCELVRKDGRRDIGVYANGKRLRDYKGGGVDVKETVEKKIGVRKEY